VRAPHPDLAPDQFGATAHRVGPRAMAAAHVTHYGLGVPVRKVPAVLRLYAGLRQTQSAITRDASRRVSGPIDSMYQALRDGIPKADVVYTDDTGRRVGGDRAHLMTFETDTATVFQVRARHRNEEVREVIGDDYPGVLVTDRGKSYDARELEGVKQQKCMAHALRSIDQVLEIKRGRARHFGARLKGLLKEGLRLWHDHHDHHGRLARFDVRVRQHRAAVTRHLKPRRLTDADNQRLLDQFGGHHARGNLVAVPGGPAGRADEPPLGARVPVRGDPAEGVAVLHDGGWSTDVRGVRQCHQDGDAPGEGCGGVVERIVPGCRPTGCTELTTEGQSSPPPYPAPRIEWTSRVQGKERLRAGGAAYQSTTLQAARNLEISAFQLCQ